MEPTIITIQRIIDHLEKQPDTEENRLDLKFWNDRKQTIQNLEGEQNV